MYKVLLKSNKQQPQHIAQPELYPRFLHKDWSIFQERVKHMALLYLRYNNAIAHALGDRWLGDGNVKFVSTILAFIHIETRINPGRQPGGNFDTELTLMVNMFCAEYYGVPMPVYRSDTFATQQKKFAALDRFAAVKTIIHTNIVLIEGLFTSFHAEHNEQLLQFHADIMRMPGGKRKSTNKSKKSTNKSKKSSNKSKKSKKMDIHS